MNIDIKTLCPNASADTVALNPHLSASDTVTPKPKEHDVQPIVAPRRGKMNKTEAEFAMILEAQKRKGGILRYEFEGITLRWFDMRYTPDFVVFPRATGVTVWEENPQIPIKFIEIKGEHIHYSQQALARFKGARGFWPEFTFEMHQRTKDGWKQII